MSNFFPAPTKEERRKSHQQIKDMCALLASCLENNRTGTAALNEQTPILNAVFHTIIAEKMDLLGSENDELTQGWLRLALQVQRQCMDSIKAESTADYLECLSTLNYSHLRNPFEGLRVPSPHENGERSE